MDDFLGQASDHYRKGGIMSHVATEPVGFHGA